MAITHVNTKGKTYYLHQGVTKTGKPKYHFTMKSELNIFPIYGLRWAMRRRWIWERMPLISSTLVLA